MLPRGRPVANSRRAGCGYCCRISPSTRRAVGTSPTSKASSRRALHGARAALSGSAARVARRRASRQCQRSSTAVASGTTAAPSRQIQSAPSPSSVCSSLAKPKEGIERGGDQWAKGGDSLRGGGRLSHRQARAGHAARFTARLHDADFHLHAMGIVPTANPCAIEDDLHRCGRGKRGGRAGARAARSLGFRRIVCSHRRARHRDDPAHRLRRQRCPAYRAEHDRRLLIRPTRPAQRRQLP